MARGAKQSRSARVPTRRVSFVPVLPATTAGAWQSCRGGPQIRQTVALSSRGVEISGVEPAFESRSQTRPFPVGDREPSGIAVAPVGYRRLPEQPFVLETESLGGGAAWRVQRIALPLVAAIAEFVEA